MKNFILLGLALSAPLSQPALAASRAPLTGLAGFIDCSDKPDQSPLAGALLGAVIGPLVEAGIKGLGNALASAGNPKEAHVGASTSELFYKADAPTEVSMPLDAQFSCLYVAAGPKGGGNDPVANSNEIFGDATDKLVDGGFTGRPAFFMLGQASISADRSAWRWTPTRLWIDQPLTQAGWASGSGRDIVVTLTIHGVAAKADDGVIASRSIVLNRVVPGKQHDPKGLAGLATGWMPLPQVSEEVAARVAAAVQRRKDINALNDAIPEYKEEAAKAKTAPEREAAEAKAAKAKTEAAELEVLSANDVEALHLLAPVTFTFDIHETRDGNKFLASLGTALAAQSKEVAAPIVERIDPAKRAEAAIEAGTKEDGYRVAAIEAVAAWKASIDSKDSDAKQRVAKIAATGACRTLQLRGFADPACLELVS